MYTGTTPTLTFTFADFDPSDADSVILTFSVGNRPFLELDEGDLTITSSAISVALTQAQTLAFPLGSVRCQINFLFDDGSRAATDIVHINIFQNLHSAEMT